MTENPNLVPNVTHQPTLLGGAENMKLLFDDTMALLSMERQKTSKSGEAWETLRYRVASNAAAFDHAVNMGSLLSAQAGTTESQQTVSPIRTGAADVQAQQPAGAVYPPIRNVDQTGAVATEIGRASCRERVSSPV